VFQKNFQWFFHSAQFGTIPFFSGMRLNWTSVLVMTSNSPPFVNLFPSFHDSQPRNLSASSR
jgi:hypothetical protein